MDTDDPFEKLLQVNFDNSTHYLKKARVTSQPPIWYYYRANHWVEDVLASWVKMSKDLECLFPTITKLAREVLAMPAMSAECERIVSQAKQTITDDRSRLGAGTIEALQCPKKWLYSGAVHSDLPTSLNKRSFSKHFHQSI